MPAVGGSRKGAGRPAKLYTLEGHSAPLALWAEVSGVPLGTIFARLRLGWTFRDAVVYPVGEIPPTRTRAVLCQK